MVKNLPANTGDARDAGLISGLRRSPAGGNGNPLQYSCLENPHGQRNLVDFRHDRSDLACIHTVTVQSLSCVRLFATLWTAAYQVSLPFTTSQSLLKLRSIELAMPSNHLIPCQPLLPSIFPNIRVFSNESVLLIRWPKYWSFNFSISPFSEYSGWISLRLTGLISWLSKGLPRVFSNTAAQKHQFCTA